MERNLCDWEEEVQIRSRLRCYRLAKDGGTKFYLVIAWI